MCAATRTERASAGGDAGARERGTPHSGELPVKKTFISGRPAAVRASERWRTPERGSEHRTGRSGSTSPACSPIRRPSSPASEWATQRGSRSATSRSASGLLRRRLSRPPELLRRPPPPTPPARPHSSTAAASPPPARPCCPPPLARRFSFYWSAGQVQQQHHDDGEVVDGNVLQYCSIDKKQKKTIGEMEQEFLRALQSFYYNQKAIMSNEEFDNLKEELMWEGSSVVMLSADEQRLLEASMAYIAGNPIMSDAEFDELKLRLKSEESINRD